VFSDENVPLWKNQVLVIESEDQTLYYTRIIDIHENTIFIQYPVNKEHVPMSQRAAPQVSVYFYDEFKEKYEFHSTVVIHNKKILLQKPKSGSIKKVQRRRHFRVPASLELSLEIGAGEKRRFITQDISGGGAAFYSPNIDTFKENESVAGCIHLNEKNDKIDIVFRARIVNVRTDSSEVATIAIEFTEIQEAARKKIIQYCLQRQIHTHNYLRRN
jgi:c-di-GMP-binding flagellar brake protein YcgR